MNIQILYLTAIAGCLLAGNAAAQQTKPAAKPGTTAQPAAKPAAAQAPAAPAQTPPANAVSPEKRAEEITNSMIKNLGLSSVQINKVRQINLESVQQMEDARARNKKNPRAMVAEAELISRTRLSKLKDVLTEMQFQKYQRKREAEMGVAQPASPTPRRHDANSYEH